MLVYFKSRYGSLPTMVNIGAIASIEPDWSDPDNQSIIRLGDGMAMVAVAESTQQIKDRFDKMTDEAIAREKEARAQEALTLQGMLPNLQMGPRRR